MPDVDSADPPDESSTEPRTLSVQGAVRAHLQSLIPRSVRAAFFAGTTGAAVANHRLDAVAAEVFARLNDIPIEHLVDPHQALMDLAAPIVAREGLHGPSPSVACMQSLINALPVTTRRVFGMYLDGNPSLRQLAEKLGMPEQVVRGHIRQAYCHLRRRLGP